MCLKFGVHTANIKTLADLIALAEAKPRCRAERFGKAIEEVAELVKRAGIKVNCLA